MTPTYDPQRPHGLPEHLRALTSLAGFTIDEDELDVTVAHYPDLIGDWVRAAVRHAAATHLRNLIDGPIQFYGELATYEPIDMIGMQIDMLADLMGRRSALTGERQQALADLTATCQALTQSDLIWRVGPVESATAGQAPAQTASGELARALTDLGMRPIRPAHPTTIAAYGHQRGDLRATVAVNPFGDPGVEINANRPRHRHLERHLRHRHSARDHHRRHRRRTRPSRAADRHRAERHPSHAAMVGSQHDQRRAPVNPAHPPATPPSPTPDRKPPQ